MVRRCSIFLLTVLALLVPATAGYAAAPTKTQLLSAWTQPTAASTNAWNAARLDRAAYRTYGFDWTTDYCSDSPDQPLGFDFRAPCAHHDFGYRNYRAIGQFAANKARVDTMFYADLTRLCAGYAALLRPACLSLAWTYYQAVHLFGSLSAVSAADLQKASRLKRDALLAG